MTDAYHAQEWMKKWQLLARCAMTAALAACDNVVDAAQAPIWRGSVEEATAGGGAAQAGQPLLALLPLKPAAERRGRRLGLANGAMCRRGGAL